MAALWLALIGLPALAEVFKYKDADGRWQFTDRPPPGATAPAPADATAVVVAPTRDLATRLAQGSTTRTPVQAATLATVAIEATLGQGAGFFISSDGYILTNRHVIRPKAEDQRAQQAQFTQEEESLTAAEAELTRRRTLLKNVETELAALKAPKQATDPYARYLKGQYDYYQAKVNELAPQVTEHQRRLSSAKLEQSIKTGQASLQQRFTIVLKDGERLTARLIRVADDQDLALLKLDGYNTPALRVNTGRTPGQGDGVYAIGNPLGVSDSVTTGRVTRIDRDQIMTDVQLLPGNSGGPLVNEAGEVIAINFAKLAKGGDANYQGFGMAIPIAIAREAFPELR
ncbi:trypsin-like peptidase domain-containing protein [uncultured Thiodictyon sp.]|uniref:trypsin-like peptidase domain-containing protein n=1 Tax=uncultured Thiodictyon sp. TaxID=1846217 RepID=UPI0025D7932C|nr:trypsin-like peptidase domain-containing protein [uncultured Thiodictyon sp.]